LADQALRLRIMNWLIATYQTGKKTIRDFAQVVMAQIFTPSTISRFCASDIPAEYSP
jgi:hypothetical protein